MNNSTAHFAVLGDGRLARHMRRYLELLGLPCSGWSRRADSPFNSHSSNDETERLRRTVAPASHVLLLVSDGAIARLVDRYPALQGRTLVHCSGALSVAGVAGAHPLMTFAHQRYTLEQYRRIPFLVESPHRFQDLLPGLPNPHQAIEAKRKALYHALCVMAGNFPQILWQAVSERFQQGLAIDAELLEPYLRQVLENFLGSPDNALTGPLARGDQATIQRNLDALEGDPLQALYHCFSEFHTGVAGHNHPAPRESAP